MGDIGKRVAPKRIYERPPDTIPVPERVPEQVPDREPERVPEAVPA